MSDSTASTSTTNNEQSATTALVSELSQAEGTFCYPRRVIRAATTVGRHTKPTCSSTPKTQQLKRHKVIQHNEYTQPSLVYSTKEAFGAKAGCSQQMQRVLDKLPQPPPPATPQQAKDDKENRRKLGRAAVQLGMVAAREREWDAKAGFTDQELVDLSHIKEIILDTGAGVCLVGKSSLLGVTEDQFLKIHPPLNLTTANGSVKAAHEIRAKAVSYTHLRAHET